MRQLIWFFILCLGIVQGNKEFYGEVDAYDGMTVGSEYDYQAQKRYDKSEDRYSYESSTLDIRTRQSSSDSLTTPRYSSSRDKKQGNTFDSRRTWNSRPSTSVPSDSEYSTQRQSSGEAYKRSNSNGSRRRPFGSDPPSRFTKYDEKGKARLDYSFNRTSFPSPNQAYSQRESYEPSYNYDTYPQASHHYGNSYSHGYRPSARKPKSHLGLFVAPLASIAFLATAAALAASPSYVTISTAGLFGRKKRALETEVDPTVANSLTPELKRKLEELQTLEKFMSTIPEETAYQQQLMSMYLSCSGYMERDNECMDRVFCEYGNAKSATVEEERDVLSIILYNIMANKHIKEDYKVRLRVAARVGRDTQQCQSYQCVELNEDKEN